MTNNKQLTTNNQKGIVSLGAIILLGGIIVEIGLAIAIIVYVLNQGSLGARISAEALAAAHSGIQDGFLRVMRNDFSTVSGIYTYHLPNVPLPPAIAIVDICDGGTTNCSGLSPYKKQVTATGIILNRKRRLVAVVELDPTTRLMKIESVKEVAL